MVQKLRERSQGEGGFTLVELLVVMLILGLLAAIAIPSFFNQRDKAKDADAKASVRTAQTAMETYATGEGGEYLGADDDALIAIENTLNDIPAGDLVVGAVSSTAGVVTGTPTATSYAVSVESSTGNLFAIQRDTNGVTTYLCGAAEEAGCPASGEWAE